jgi:hypothetical protein
MASETRVEMRLPRPAETRLPRPAAMRLQDFKRLALPAFGSRILSTGQQCGFRDHSSNATSETSSNTASEHSPPTAQKMRKANAQAAAGGGGNARFSGGFRCFLRRKRPGRGAAQRFFLGFPQPGEAGPVLKLRARALAGKQSTRAGG